MSFARYATFSARLSNTRVENECAIAEPRQDGTSSAPFARQILCGLAGEPLQRKSSQKVLMFIFEPDIAGVQLSQKKVMSRRCRIMAAGDHFSSDVSNL